MIKIKDLVDPILILGFKMNVAGAALATVAILTHHEFSLAIVGGVFVIETLSVILQTFWVIVFKRKLFLMTPLHALQQLGLYHSSYCTNEGPRDLQI